MDDPEEKKRQNFDGPRKEMYPVTRGKNRYPLFLVAAALFFSLLFAADAMAAEKTTVMVYLCGSNLESRYGLASRDIQEILDADYDKDRTEVLILAGGSTEWHNGIDPKQTHLCRVSPANTLVDLPETSGQKNMGDPETLFWFLTYGAEQFPADRYALIIWDHGGGPLQGVCWDETFEKERLTIPELTQALENSPFREQKLEWIGFDACLMATLEVAGQLSPYADYMIASQEREPGSGWSYSFLRGLEEDRSGGDTGKRIVDAYLDNPDAGSADKTLSCIDLRSTGALSTALESFFAEKSRQISAETFPDLSRIRQASRSFGVNRAGDNDSYDLVDLGGLLTQLQADGDVMSALRQTVVYSRSNMQGATGLCVYHPMLNTSGYLSEWKQQYGEIGFSDAYASYIQAFAGILTGERLIYWNNLVTTAGEREFTCRLSEEQARYWLDGRMTVMGKELADGADDAWYMLYTTDRVTLDEDHVLHGTYTGKSLYLVDGADSFELTTPIEYQLQGNEYYIILYPYNENRELVDTIMGIYTLDEATDTLVLKEYQIYDWTLENFTTRAEIDFSRYAGIAFERYSRNMVRNEYGEIMPPPYWNRDYHADSLVYYPGFNLNFRFVTHDLYEGIVQVMFEIRDTQHHWAASEPVQVSHTVSPLEISLSVEEDDRLEIRPFGYADESRISRVTPLGLVVTNRSDTALTVKMDETCFNGIPLDIGIGRTIAAGETGVLSFPLDLEWLPWLRPQRTLREISGMFSCWPEEHEEQARRMPYAMTLEMSLASMYRSTTVLPDESADWDTPAPVAEGDTWSVFVSGISSLDGRLVLTLEYENRGGTDLYFNPDCFLGNGVKWNGGVVQFSRLNGYDGNGLRILPGQTEYAPPLLSVPAGSRLTDYVQVTPADEASVSLTELVFRMHIYDTEGVLNLLTEAIPLEFAGGITVAEGTSLAVRADQVGLPTAAMEERYGINNLAIDREVAASPLSEADMVTLVPPAGTEGCTAGYYRIVLLADSEDELYDRGIFIYPNEREKAGASFPGTPLVIPVLYGKLTETNGTLQAECLPWIAELHAGGDKSLILHMMFAKLSDGLFYEESIAPVRFTSHGSGYFADEIREISLGAMPREGRVFSSGALWVKYGAADDTFDTIRVDGPLVICPPEAMTEGSNPAQWPNMTGYQSCDLASSTLQLSLRKPGPEDHLYVLFELTDAQGKEVFLPPVPLSEYLSPEGRKEGK